MWAVIVILATIAALYYFGVFNGIQYVPSQCFLGQSVPCTSYLVSSYDSGALLAFSGRNDLGFDIGFDAGAVNATSDNLGLQGSNSFIGNCSPAIVKDGGAYSCVVLMPGDYVPRAGTSKDVDVAVTYKNCATNPGYPSSRDCSSPPALAHTLQGRITAQVEPPTGQNASALFCGNGICDSMLGENESNCAQDCTPTVFTVDTSASPASIAPGAGSQSTVTARVLDQSGNPLEGKIVSFAKNSSSGNLGAPSNTTGPDGGTQVTFVPGDAEETVRINATCEGITGETEVDVTESAPG
jgi:hypothetical protein